MYARLFRAEPLAFPRKLPPLPASAAFLPLQALQFRLREDLRASGGNLAAFDQLKETRGLEYELDRLQNRAGRDKQVGVGWGWPGGRVPQRLDLVGPPKR